MDRSALPHSWLHRAGLALCAAAVAAACLFVLLRGRPKAVPAQPAAARMSPIVDGVRFERMTGTGIDFRWPQQPRPMRILDTIGRGCAFLDYDRDGLLDLLLIGGPRAAL